MSLVIYVFVDGFGINRNLRKILIRFFLSSVYLDFFAMSSIF